MTSKMAVDGEGARDDDAVSFSSDVDEPGVDADIDADDIAALLDEREAAAPDDDEAEDAGVLFCEENSSMSRSPLDRRSSMADSQSIFSISLKRRRLSKKYFSLFQTTGETTGTRTRSVYGYRVPGTVTDGYRKESFARKHIQYIPVL